MPYVVFAFVVGNFADRFNRAKFYVVSSFINTIPLFALSFGTKIDQLIFIQVIQGLANSLFVPVAEVLISDVAPNERRVTVMGRLSVSVQSGFIVGPLMGGIISQIAGFRILFLSSAALMLLTGVASLLTIPKHYKPPERILVTRTNDFLFRNVLPIYLTMLPYGTIVAVLVTIFPGYLANLGFESTRVGLVLALLSVARILASINIERIVSFSSKRTITGAATVLMVSLVFISYQRDILGLSFGVFLAGLAIGLVYPTALAVISQRFSSGGIGTAIGLLETSFGLGSIAGPIAGGLLAEYLAPDRVYLSLGLLAALMIPFSLTWERRKEKD